MTERLRKLVTRQASDPGLWFDAATAPEAYLQKALREVHAEIEHDEEMVALCHTSPTAMSQRQFECEHTYVHSEKFCRCHTPQNSIWFCPQCRVEFCIPVVFSLILANALEAVGVVGESMTKMHAGAASHGLL
jgi:hypothetical protein